MGATAIIPCANCQRLQEQLDAQKAQLDAFAERMATLEAQLAAARKDSSTSSKPPSSDIVKPPKPERTLIPPEQLTMPPHDYVPEICPDCGHGLRPAGDDVRVVQQIEIAEMPILIEEHRSHPRS